MPMLDIDIQIRTTISYCFTPLHERAQKSQTTDQLVPIILHVPTSAFLTLSRTQRYTNNSRRSPPVLLLYYPTAGHPFQPLVPRVRSGGRFPLHRDGLPPQAIPAAKGFPLRGSLGRGMLFVYWWLGEHVKASFTPWVLEWDGGIAVRSLSGVNTPSRAE